MRLRIKALISEFYDQLVTLLKNQTHSTLPRAVLQRGGSLKTLDVPWHIGGKRCYVKEKRLFDATCFICSLDSAELLLLLLKGTNFTDITTRLLTIGPFLANRHRGKSSMRTH